MKIIGVEDARSYAADVLESVARRAKENGIKMAEPSYEGVRLVFPDGWALLRMSLHDPNMPLNIEADAAGGADEIERTVKELIAGFDALDLSGFQS